MISLLGILGLQGGTEAMRLEHGKEHARLETTTITERESAFHDKKVKAYKDETGVDLACSKAFVAYCRSKKHWKMASTAPHMI